MSKPNGDKPLFWQSIPSISLFRNDGDNNDDRDNSSSSNNNSNNNKNDDDNNDDDDDDDDDIEIQESKRKEKSPNSNKDPTNPDPNENKTKTKTKNENKNKTKTNQINSHCDQRFNFDSNSNLKYGLELELELESSSVSNSKSTKSTKSNTTNTTMVFDPWHEFRVFLQLAIANLLTNLGFGLAPLLTASYVGRRFGPVCLSAFSLANLVGNLCTQTIVVGLLDAIDTLGPQAIGRGDFQALGKLCARGLAVAAVVLVPINIALLLWMGDALVALGEDPRIARYAHEWYTIYIATLPFSVGFQITCRFLTVQNITTPVIVVSLLASATIAPLLEWACSFRDEYESEYESEYEYKYEYIKKYETNSQRTGFLATAVVYVVFCAFQCGLLLFWVLWRKPHDPRTWPFSSDRKAHGSSNRSGGDGDNDNDNDNGGGGYSSASASGLGLAEFLSLALGGVFAQCEWVFWEALGLLVGTLGVVPMTVHAIPTQIIFTVSLTAFSVGTALAIRMGHWIPVSVQRARSMAALVVMASTVVFGGMACALYRNRRPILAFFVDTNADATVDANENADANANADITEVLELAESIWLEASYCFGIVSLFAVLVGISTGLGKQWDLARVNVVMMWGLGMPVIYAATVLCHGGLKAAWFWMNVAYTGICGFLVWDFFGNTDWQNTVRDGSESTCSSCSSSSSSNSRHGSSSSDSTNKDILDEDETDDENVHERTALLGY